MERNQYLLTNLLSEEEARVITSITTRIERGEKRPGIQQIANENYLSTAFIIKMCKRLGFDGYSELYYHLARRLSGGEDKRTGLTLETLVDNYSDALVGQFCAMLYHSRGQKLFTSGEGFSDLVVSYMVQRLSVCGFLAYNHVNFYDFMLFQKEHERVSERPEPSLMFAVSQSGETEPVINDVRHARQNGYKIVGFTKRDDATLFRLSDIAFLVDSSKQTLVGGIPNPFFGHVILAFEELMGAYFGRLAAMGSDETQN